MTFGHFPGDERSKQEWVVSGATQIRGQQSHFEVGTGGPKLLQREWCAHGRLKRTGMAPGSE